MHRKLIVAFIVSIVLIGCGGREAEEQEPQAAIAPLDTAVPPAPTDPPLPTSTATSRPEPTATQTAEPPPTPTAVPTELPTAEPETESEEAAVEFAEDVPEIVWLPFGEGTYGEPILTMRDGIPNYEPEPVPIEIFFDYSPILGQIAYGDVFWEAAANGIDSVTDLWVYDYETEESEQWLDGNVGRAAWSPINADDEVLLAAAVHNGDQFDLVLVPAADETIIIRENIDPFFSWSPDGELIAYVQDNQLFVGTPFAQGIEVLIASGVYENSGWVGDAPVWDLERDILIYAADPFTIAALDGSLTYTPKNLDDTPLTGESRPLKMLWSSELRQLIVQTEGMFSDDVQIYLLSEDLRHITDIYFLEESILVDWDIEDESIVVLDIDQEPLIWSLTEQDYIMP